MVGGMDYQNISRIVQDSVHVESMCSWLKTVSEQLHTPHNINNKAASEVQSSCLALPSSSSLVARRNNQPSSPFNSNSNNIGTMTGATATVTTTLTQ